MAESAILASAILSEPALEAWGREVGRVAAAGGIAPPLVVALRGPLGAGKSVLARAIARGAGVDSPMPSPTYNLVFRYEGARPGTGHGAGNAGEPVVVHHLDLYRLEDPDDVWELGWQELGEGDQIVLIEWPDRAEALLPPDRWDVTLSFVDDDAARRLEVRRLGDAPVPPAPTAPTGGPGGAGSGRDSRPSGAEVAR